MSGQLRECPCCGGNAAFHQVPYQPETANSGGIYIECEGCGLTTELMFSIMDDAKPELAEKWNRRVTVSSAGFDAGIAAAAGVCEARAASYDRDADNAHKGTHYDMEQRWRDMAAQCRQDAIAIRALSPGGIEAGEAERLLRELVKALDDAFISTWQSTAAWQKQLDDARAHLSARGGK